MSGALVNSSNGILIGKRHVGTHAHCYLDEIRVVKGVAKYTTNFTPPTAPFDPVTGEGTAGRLVLPNETRLAARSGNLGEMTASAWVSFDGTGTIAINDSYNVSSLTDSGTGDYVVNYATNLENTNYSAYAGSWAPSTTATLGLAIVGDITVSGADVTNRYVVDSGSGASCGYCYYDAERMSVVIFGGK
jgi:hypothetical protein